MLLDTSRVWLCGEIGIDTHPMAKYHHHSNHNTQIRARVTSCQELGYFPQAGLVFSFSNDHIHQVRWISVSIRFGGPPTGTRARPEGAVTACTLSSSRRFIVYVLQYKGRGERLRLTISQYNQWLLPEAS